MPDNMSVPSITMFFMHRTATYARPLNYGALVLLGHMAFNINRRHTITPILVPQDGSNEVPLIEDNFSLLATGGTVRFQFGFGTVAADNGTVEIVHPMEDLRVYQETAPLVSISAREHPILGNQKL
jgi:hypothetical protein